VRLRAALAGLLVAVGGAAAAYSQIEPLHVSKAPLRVQGLPLYVPTGRSARLIAAGHESSLADLLYLWSIQHFSEPTKDPAERAGWLRRVYGTITDLDPKFRDAYWLGYVSLLVEGRDIDGALGLVDKALENDPQFTVLAVEAAIAARRAGRTDATLRYLETASASGDKLALRLLLRVRESETAQEELQAWASLLDDEDSLTRHIAGAHVRDLTRLVTSSELSALVECYRAEHGGLAPASLDQLVRGGYAREIPLDPEGRPYQYDRRTGAVVPSVPYVYRPPSSSRLGVDLSHLGRCAPGAAAP
jgi:hypothetical protein